MWAAIALPWGIALVYAVIRLKALLLFLVRFYQRVAPISLRKRCRFEPSCSQYMLISIEKYGACKGFIKGFRRWCSCKPPNGGFDEP
ncbi:MAG: membrane protein insertion efficiency factor YidD [Clostridia bacterium]|nr:membrane protein insertion efficiency factor YidD [Clostridia bacterium]